ncbi:hypothetical protein, variant [Phytophthora nicotianae P10297]|nr:hypothetical protein F442_05972 [Phytophthora nicotianae P10297]ETP48259.1 hypothetical protein, variant [Phytophthora nicotianae P10297]
MQDTSQVPLYVDAVSAFRKYKENDRAVIVGSMMWLLPIEGLEFEGKYWSVMDPSPSDPSQASVIRFCYKLQVKNGGTKSASRIQQVMNSIGNQVRLYLQLQQDAFLSAASPIKGC